MLISDNYLTLLINYLPRPVTSAKELAEVQTVIDSFLDKPKLSQDESDYLNVLRGL